MKKYSVEKLVNGNLALEDIKLKNPQINLRIFYFSIIVNEIITYITFINKPSSVRIIRINNFYTSYNCSNLYRFEIRLVSTSDSFSIFIPFVLMFNSTYNKVLSLIKTLIMCLFIGFI
jgi:hypothetical protein